MVADLKAVDRSKTPWVVVVSGLAYLICFTQEGRLGFLDFSPMHMASLCCASLVERRCCVCCMQGFHRPIYTTSLEGVTLASDLVVASDLRDAYEQIFFQYEV